MAVMSVAACTKPVSLPSATPSSHDASWIDSAVALVGTQSGHDPVVRVAIDPSGVTVTTRRTDNRVQRVWRVPLDSASPTPRATLTPAPSARPRSTSNPARDPASATASASTRTTASAGGSASARPTGHASGSASSRASARPTPTPVFATPSGVPATPLPTPGRVDNTLGNMELGSFGDTQVTPMWQWMQAQGCRADNWSMVLTGTWAGNVVDHGSCGTQHAVLLDGARLPQNRAESALIAAQLRRFNGLVTDQVSRVTVTRTGERTCPTRLSVDYQVQLGGPLNLRTTMTCGDLTTQMLSCGWLPVGTLSIGDLQAKGIEAVFRDQAARHQKTTALVAQHSLLYGQPVLVAASSPTGRPAYGTDGTLKK